MSNTTLRNVSEDCQTILDEAYGVFKSKTYRKFLFVEGISDKKFLKNKGFDEESYFYLGMDGKPLVLACLDNYSNSRIYQEINKIAFLIDNDYDHILNNIKVHEHIFIHSICKNENKHYLNDLEVYLVESEALFFWLEEFNLKKDQILDLRKNVEMESRRIGKYRAANELLKKNKMMDEKSTILFDFKIEDFIEDKNFLFLERDFESRLKICSPHKEYVDELCALSDQINTAFPQTWALSRGHDVTELISIYLYLKYDIDLNIKQIERYLRLSVDTTTLKRYHLYNSLCDFFNN
ncbi:hypothetical protein [Acinetobacter pittii]|uniref:hypothetical protein n=1 Tax=Acinetobacter pittii TaxID=48296 RepID=UPI002813BC3A|nr:hypothetical protein [Acinetobacter pittii]MDQ9887611.1 hypothetical protein [Acinetobacter pittii]